MITIHVEQHGLNIKMFAENFQTKVVEPLINVLADEAYRIMCEKAPVRTGALRASITKNVRAGEAEVGPTMPYAVYVEYGTRPHVIRPVYARALRFKVEGEIVFSMVVHHPGTRPQPFVRETASEVVMMLPRLVEKVWMEAVE